MLARSIAVFACAVALTAPVQAVVSSYTDRPSFIADTSSAAQPALSDVGIVGQPFVHGDMTFTSGPDATDIYSGLGPGDWSARIPGVDLAISGDENYNIVFANAIYAFGFDFHEPETDPNIGGFYFVESNFEITLFSNNVGVGSAQFSPPNDTLTFMGVWSSASFDRVEIRELNNDAGDGGENEFLGNFLTGDEPAVPAPGVLTCLILAAPRRPRRR